MSAAGVAAVARRRKMCRSYLSDAVPAPVLDRVLESAHRAPSAGNAQARDFLVLDTPEAVARYWAVTLSPGERTGFPWPGLLLAPAIVVLWTRPGAYTERYALSDKSATGLGVGEHVWPVPYWWVDGGMAAEAMLLTAEDEGLGACFFGLFDHEPAVRAEFQVPDDRRAVGAISLGWPDVSGDRRSLSGKRGRPDVDTVVHKGAW